MNYSGLLVSCKPGKFSEMLQALGEMDNVEVHHEQEESGRCIVVLECSSVAAEVDEFKAISELSCVMDVALIVHHFDEEAHIKSMVGTDPLN